jgi:hypothetical protein
MTIERTIKKEGGKKMKVKKFVNTLSWTAEVISLVRVIVLTIAVAMRNTFWQAALGVEGGGLKAYKMCPFWGPLKTLCRTFISFLSFAPQLFFPILYPLWRHLSHILFHSSFFLFLPLLFLFNFIQSFTFLSYYSLSYFIHIIFYFCQLYIFTSR